MVEERVTDGKRIAQLLSSEVDGREDAPLDELTVVNADPNAEGTVDGALAFEIQDGSESTPFASVFIQEDRAYVELKRGVDAAKEAASEAELRVRPKAVEPPRTLVFIESGGEVKRAVNVLIAAIEANDEASA